MSCVEFPHFQIPTVLHPKCIFSLAAAGVSCSHLPSDIVARVSEFLLSLPSLFCAKRIAQAVASVLLFSQSFHP